jgi:phosphoribosylaminoimidazolecarboxamide formyltransferase/IMP cyclohydrolase
MITAELKTNNGALPLNLRYRLAQKAFDHTAVYDRTIADFLGAQALADVESCYQ